MINKRLRISTLLVVFIVIVLFDYTVLQKSIDYEKYSFITILFSSLLPLLLIFKFLPKLKKYLLVCEFLLCMGIMYIFMFLHTFNESLNITNLVLVWFGFMITAIIIEVVNDLKLILIPVALILIVLIITSFGFLLSNKITFNTNLSIMFLSYYYLFVFRFAYSRQINQQEA